jgi:hypothetical protein
VFPELDLIFVTTANGSVDPETGVHQEIGIGRIVLDYLFPALTDAELDHELHIER